MDTMFTRSEVCEALSSVDTSSNSHFGTFLEAISRIHPHAIYGKVAEEIITDALYGEGFDAIVSSIIVMYAELVNMRDAPTSLRGVYEIIYSSSLLDKVGTIVWPYPTAKDPRETKVLLDLIVLLNIYSRDIDPAK